MLNTNFLGFLGLNLGIDVIKCPRCRSSVLPKHISKCQKSFTIENVPYIMDFFHSNIGIRWNRAQVLGLHINNDQNRIRGITLNQFIDFQIR